jgi:hypothetical protein
MDCDQNRIKIPLDGYKQKIQDAASLLDTRDCGVPRGFEAA